MTGAFHFDRSALVVNRLGNFLGALFVAVAVDKFHGR
jgi:hypothetical protein